MATSPDILVTTSEVPPGWHAHALLGEVLGIATRSLSPYSEGLRSLMDGTSCSPDVRYHLLISCRLEAVERMRAAARERGANAVIAMRFDHRPITEGSIEICAYGTAVVLGRVPSQKNLERGVESGAPAST